MPLRLSAESELKFRRRSVVQQNHLEGNPEANLKSISHRCFLWEVAFEQELTQETIYLPLSCLQVKVQENLFLIAVMRNTRPDVPSDLS